MTTAWHWLEHLPGHLLTLDPALLLTMCGLLVFAEDAIFVGFVVPGESAAVVAGVASSVGRVSLTAAIVVVVLAAIVGDSVGYEWGRILVGPRLLDSRLLRGHRSRIDAASAFLRRRGAVAVFLGRFTAFFRAVMPALAGAAHMPYRRFLLWNALGGIVWGTGFVVLGHLAGQSYQALEKRAGTYVAVALVVVVLAVIVVWRVRRSRSDPEHPAGDPGLPEH